MVVSLPDLRAALFAGLMLLPALAQSASPRAVERGGERGDEYVLDGRNLRLDTRANQIRVSDVTITQGGIRVHATEAMAQAEKKTFDNSRWEFSGDVDIRFQDGSLVADTATIRIVGNRIVRAAATGTPAKFEHKLASMALPVRGRAKDVDYDVQSNKVRLSGDVQFANGGNEFKMQALIYDLGTQDAQSDNAPGDPDRVHMKFRPNDAAEAPPPAGAPTP